MTGTYEELKALDFLMRDGEQSDRELRDKINVDLINESPDYVRLAIRFKCGCLFNVKMSAVAFYAMMTRLEDTGEVEGWYKNIEMDGYQLKQRWYRVKEGGRRRLDTPSETTAKFGLGLGHA